jgi:hypothetical protein
LRKVTAPILQRDSGKKFVLAVTSRKTNCREMLVRLTRSNERYSKINAPMSALGQERKFGSIDAMSALPLKADI